MKYCKKIVLVVAFIGSSNLYGMDFIGEQLGSLFGGTAQQGKGLCSFIFNATNAVTEARSLDTDAIKSAYAAWNDITDVTHGFLETGKAELREQYGDYSDEKKEIANKLYKEMMPFLHNEESSDVF